VKGKPLEILKGTLTHMALIGLAIALMAPFVWMVLVSLHPSRSPIPEFSKVIPSKPEWDNYRKVLFNPAMPVARFFWNSLIVAIAVVLGQLLTASMAAYALARLNFKGREAIFSLFVGSMMFAGLVLQIPVYLLIRSFGWLDTYGALIVPGIGSAFSVFLLRQFFLSIPMELSEAARLDGATDFQIYSRIIVPLGKASLATAGAFTFFGTWTDFFGPMLVTNSTEMRTLEVGLSVYKNSYGGTNWPLQMTAAVVVMIPLVMVFLALQRYFVRGVLLGAGK